MVVVHDYSRDEDSPSSPSPQSPTPPPSGEIDDDRAFVVGLWVISGIIILTVVLIVARASLSAKPVENEEEISPEIMGEQVQEEVPSVENQAPAQMPIDSETKDVDKAKKAEELSKEIPGSEIYTVESGDTLFSIGSKTGISWKKIAEINGISPPYSLHTGDQLVIPPEED